MDKIDKVTRKIFYAGILVWCICAGFKLIDLPTTYITLGILVGMLSIKNIAIVVLGVRNNQLPEKMTQFTDRYGSKKGITIYSLFFIGLYLLIAVLLIISGLVT